MTKNALDHLHLFEDAEESTNFEWPNLLNQHASYIFRNIGADKKTKKIKKINIADISSVLGGIITKQKKPDAIITLDFEVYKRNGNTTIDLSFLPEYSGAISASAISGQYLERVLFFYCNAGSMTLNACKNGVFWIKPTVLL